MLSPLKVLLQRLPKSVACGSYFALEETGAHSGEVGPRGWAGGMQGLTASPKFVF